MTNITQSLKVIVLAIVLSFGISYVFAWAPPTVAPTGGNSTAPLNTSLLSQIKSGNLTLNALGITNTAVGALNVAGGAVFGRDIVVANGSGITLGGVKKTVWPSSGTADWNTMINKPADFADNVDNAQVKNTTIIYSCPSLTGQLTWDTSARPCNGQLSLSSTCFADSRGTTSQRSCTPVGYLVQ